MDDTARLAVSWVYLVVSIVATTAIGAAGYFAWKSLNSLGESRSGKFIVWGLGGIAFALAGMVIGVTPWTSFLGQIGRVIFILGGLVTMAVAAIAHGYGWYLYDHEVRQARSWQETNEENDG